MDDPFAMRLVQGVGHLSADRRDLADIWRLIVDAGRKRLARHVLHRDEMCAAGVPDLVDVRDVGVCHRRGGLSFLPEAAEPVAILRHSIGEDFQGHVAAQARVLREVDVAHPARAKEPEDFVRTEPRTGGKGHSRCPRLYGQ
jgi:hypothetical protein